MATFMFRRLLVRRMSTFEIAAVSRTFLFRNNFQSSLKQIRIPTLCVCNNIHSGHDYNKNVVRYASKQSNSIKKLSIFQRFKQMYKDYWYVLVPVHLVTSAGWFGGFYYLAKSGIDVVAIMESWNFSERITNPLKDSSMGYIAIAYALYKIATPFRYTVTLGGTTVSINYFKKWGLIKPVPSRQELSQMYKDRKETIMCSMKDKKEELTLKKEQLKDRTEDLIGDMEKKLISKIKDSKDKFSIGKELKGIKKETH